MEVLLIEREIMNFCAFCFTILPQSEEVCPFCQEHAWESPYSLLKAKGTWSVGCSCDGKISSFRPVLILGREEPYTRFLFGSFISAQHARLEEQEGKIRVMDMESTNGTFFVDNSLTEEGRNSWKRLSSEESVCLSSGDLLLLGKQSLCRIWLRWCPQEILSPLERRTQEQSIELPQTGNMLLDDNICFFREKQNAFLEDKSTGSVLVNRKKIAVCPLKEGDRIFWDESEYEYYSSCLKPCAALVAPKIQLIGVNVKNRLDIPELTLEPAKLIGILGHSGSGKSTLIKVLTGWIEYQGKVLLSQDDKGDFPKAYIPQYDIVLDNLKVQNSLLYTALLHDTQKSLAALQEKVARHLAFVRLSAKANDLIFSLSGGQRKRVNIAQELIAKDSSWMLLDEPTSGLDPASDEGIIQLLRDLAHQGRTIVCTTHNLGSIRYFDRIVPLHQGQIQANTTPEDLALSHNLSLEPGLASWSKLYQTEDTTIQKTAFPFWKTMLRKPWWILLIRRIEEFFTWKKDFFPLFSLLFLIPLFIGFSLYIARYESNADTIRFFLCSVAAFWLGMSLSSQELRKKRYSIFLHEKNNGISIRSFFTCYCLFYTGISFIQTLTLTLPSLYLLWHKSHLYQENNFTLSLSLFFALVWSMGICGSLCGLVASLFESRGFTLGKFSLSIPAEVSVPCLTIVQLIFSEMVMGRILGDQNYFSWQCHSLRDFCYTITFSRYTDMAFKSYSNLQTDSGFYYNLACFLLIGFLLPSLVFYLFLHQAKAKEESIKE